MPLEFSWVVQQTESEKQTKGRHGETDGLVYGRIYRQTNTIFLRIEEIEIRDSLEWRPSFEYRLRPDEILERWRLGLIAEWKDIWWMFVNKSKMRFEWRGMKGRKSIHSSQPTRWVVKQSRGLSQDFGKDFQMSVIHPMFYQIQEENNVTDIRISHDVNVRSVDDDMTWPMGYISTRYQLSLYCTKEINVAFVKS